MALIKNAELWFARVIPSRPNKKFNKENPTWEVQLRTYDVKQKKEWEAQGLRMKAVVPEEEGERPYWKTTLKKKIYKRDGEPSSPVEVVNGDRSEADPATIGNRSIGHVRVFQYEYSGDNGKGLANVLQGIQLKKLIKYTPKARDDDFEDEEMEVVEAEDDAEEQDQDDNDEDGGEEEAPKPKSPPSPKPKSKFD